MKNKRCPPTIETLRENKEEYNTILHLKAEPHSIQPLKEMKVNQLAQTVISSLKVTTKMICSKKKNRN